MPFIVRWPGHVRQGESDALVCQVDLPASLAALGGQSIQFPESAIPDSFNVLPAILGETKQGREHLVEHAKTLALRQGHWKLIEAGKGPKINKNTNTELGNDRKPQLYNLADDPAERKNVAAANPEKVKELTALLEKLRREGRSRP